MAFQGTCPRCGEIGNTLFLSRSLEGRGHTAFLDPANYLMYFHRNERGRVCPGIAEHPTGIVLMNSPVTITQDIMFHMFH